MELGVALSFRRSVVEYAYHAKRGLSLTLRELHEASNVSNDTCNPLLEGVKDGNIPSVLGISFAVWLVSNYTVTCSNIRMCHNLNAQYSGDSLGSSFAGLLLSGLNLVYILVSIRYIT